MANPNVNEKSQPSTISNAMHDATSSIRDTARESSRPVRDTSERTKGGNSERLEPMDAGEMMERASETASQFYEQASRWMRDNNRSLYLVGGFVAAGLVGYLIGRGTANRSSSKIEEY